MSFGVTDQGFVKKTLADIQAESEAAFRSKFGDAVNLDPRGPLGQIKEILDERVMLLWELAEDVYYSQYPPTASGINLDNVAAITGIVRKPATKSTISTGRGRGTLSTVIPAGTVISVENEPNSRFVTDQNTTISVAAVNEVQDIDFSAVPDAGQWAITFDGEETSLLAFNANAAAVEAALEALPNLASVTVAGNYTSGFTVTFDGADGGKPQPPLSISQNTLTASSVAVTTTVVETTPGDNPKTPLMTLTAESAGAIQAPANTLNVIETPVVGLDSYTNELAADVGNNDETDAELKIRRQNELQLAGSATINAIRSEILSILNVDAAVVFHNPTDVTDSEGRPPHSVDVIVEGGVDQDIADKLFDVVAAGITYFGSESETVVDDQGFNHTVKFSRPVLVNIFVHLTLTTVVGEYAGDAAVKQAIKDHGDDLEIGDDVVVFGTNSLLGALDGIAGITDVVIKIGIVAFPTPGSAVFTASDGSPDLLLTAAGTPLVVGDRVTFTNSGGSLPTGLTAATLYFVVFDSGNDFKVSVTRGGTPIVFVNAGTGTHTVFWGGSDENLVIGGREKANFELANMTVVS